ncbi:carboxypeptidase-like regulatory domain-containing protein [Hyalangium minutum]|uniref:Carboxypeptidase regulatory-like domain-containing protein n=1 Tax=Hyalangium minutum TaxID=394096 RepID=A0A085WM40_9BACT|nr:carboxypeptidase-like regulatory domain-containing protein [Hyalangium minutum]KFE68753.1 hypothetical protein DB31_7990 [Hyalangium minutum]
MRRQAWGVIGAAVVGLGVVVFLGLPQGTDPESTQVSQRPEGASGKRKQKVHATPTPPPSGTLSIRGLVKVGQAPVAGVRVSATRPMPGETLSELPCPVDESDPAPSSRGKRLPECMREARAQVLELVQGRYGEAPVYAETVTGADGSFALEGLPEGEFTLWALGEQGAELRPQVAAGAEGVELVLGEGVTVEGRVVDASEHPLSEVRLTVLHAKYTRFFDVRTSADGRFQVGPLPKGEYALVAEKEEWLPEFLPPYLVRSRTAVVLYQPVRLAGLVLSEGTPAPGTEVRLTAGSEAGQVTTADAQGRFVFEGLKPLGYELTAERAGRFARAEVHLRTMELSAEEVVLRLGESRHVEGTVRDDAGNPIPGARVALWRKRDYGQNWKVFTDEEGHYRVGPLPLSDYVFDVTAPRYRHVENEVHAITREPVPLDFTLPRAFSLAGTLVDEEGVPVAEASLELISGDGEQPQGTQSNTMTEEDGRFVLDAPAAGTWTLSTEDERFLPEKKQVQVPSENLRWVLRRGARIDGSVTDAEGTPMSEVGITVWMPGEEGEWSYSRRAMTDAQGRFSVSGMEAGSYRVEASLTDEGVERSASQPVTLRDNGRAEVALRFETGWSLSGLAVDEAGQPVAEATINVYQPPNATAAWRRNRFRCGNDRPRIVTGRDGRFTLEHLTGEQYVLWAYKEGYIFLAAKSEGAAAVDEDSIRVRSGTEQVRLVFQSQARIRGRLVDPDGAPIPRFELNMRFMSDAQGAFTTPITETGTQHLLFGAPGMAQTTRAVKVQEGVDVDLGEVRMEPGRRVRGVVVDAETGAPQAGAEVRVLGPAREQEEGLARPSLFMRAQDDGTFEFPHVESEPLQLEVSHTNYRMARVALGASDASVTVRLVSGATVVVSAVDSAGRPLDADVRFILERDESSWETLDVVEGVGQRRGLEPGSYWVQLSTAAGTTEGFVPQRAEIPEQGQVKLAFVQRKAGPTLVLRTEGLDEGVEAILLPGAFTVPVSMKTVPLWTSMGLSGVQDEGVRRFTALSPGRVRLLLFAGPPARFHLEELELPAEGVVERGVQPRWQPMPEK